MVTWKNTLRLTQNYSFNFQMKFAEDNGYAFFVYKGKIYNIDGVHMGVNISMLDERHKEDCKEFFRLGYENCHPSNKKIELSEGLLNIFSSSYTVYGSAI